MNIGTNLQPSMPLTVTDRRHYTALGTLAGEEAGRGPAFSAAMLGALDKVSASQNTASSLAEKAIVDPDSVDIHDVTIAEAEASMSLGIARTLLSRLTTAWKEVVNMR